MKKALIMLVYLFAALAAQAQMAEAPRAFSGRIVDSLRQVEAYQYGKEPGKSTPKPKTQRHTPSVEKEKTGSTITWIIYLFIAGILIVVAFVVLRQFSGTTGKRVDRPAGIQIETEEDLIQSDFQSLASAAEADNNWRLAFRYQYLWVLQQLQHRKHIDWHPYKTDTDYLREIKNQKKKAAFERIIRAYSFIWYGQKEINQAQYQRLQSYFKAFS